MRYMYFFGGIIYYLYTKWPLEIADGAETVGLPGTCHLQLAQSRDWPGDARLCSLFKHTGPRTTQGPHCHSRPTSLARDGLQRRPEPLQRRLKPSARTA